MEINKNLQTCIDYKAGGILLGRDGAVDEI